ncbi:MAG: glycogen-binding domain-containing protein, partial [Myxococcales bacterium]|nr:glycogen-binding domain-containing protein [Myxococcales bacterium]
MSHAHRSLAALALVVAACSSSGGHGDADTDDATETDGATITIGDGDGDSGGDDGDVPGASCDAPIPRALRLLTRREYEATVLALVPLDDAADPGDAGDACEADADCDLSRESCTAGSCQADPCPLHTFVLDDPGHAHASVHVAGSFNGWPASVADGGWALEYVDAAGAWVTKRPLEDGTHTYKFV